MQEERRRSDDKNWNVVTKFIDESREYRTKDEMTQKLQVDNIEALKNAVKIQNGRVYTLEKWKEEIEIKIKQRKDNYANIQAIITLLATVVMGVSAAIMIWKK